MQLDDSLIVAPALEEEIDRHPLTVAPNRLLKDVIALMSQARGTHCSVASLNSPEDGWSSAAGVPMRETRSSCVLVMEGSELLGIFTERDIVRLTANGVNFEGVKIAEVMTHPAITLPSGQAFSRCYSLTSSQQS
ncbi:MAG: CBS domain-containing protein [Hormoscilla sp. GM102CHS1]|nr:CBS domain-containing protein [Hormoscilla sp. GM102CHS1]